MEKDDTDNVYMHNSDKWVGYDTAETIERKMNYVRSNGFGGGMIWAIDLDDYLGQCGEKWDLLNTINRVLNCNFYIYFKFWLNDLKISNFFQKLMNPFQLNKNPKAKFQLLLENLSIVLEPGLLLHLTTAKVIINVPETEVHLNWDVQTDSISTQKLKFVIGQIMLNAKLKIINDVLTRDFLLILKIVVPCFGA